MASNAKPGAAQHDMLFFGRKAEVDTFLRAVNLTAPQAPTHPAILFFHGPHGIGKSALLKHLCRAVLPGLYGSAWQSAADSRPWVKRYSQQGSVRSTDKQVAVAHLDFAFDGNAIECVKIGAVGLYSIARQLARYDVKCPVFSVACFAHFKEWARATSKNEFGLLKTEEMKALNEIWTAVQHDNLPGVKVGIAVLDLLRKHVGWLLDKSTEDAVATRIKALKTVDPAIELAGRLPELLAEDINHAVRHEHGPARVVLLFDSHDAFWRADDRPTSGAYYRAHDPWWLRRFLRGLDRAGGITAVVAGTDPPDWASSTKDPIARQEVTLHSVPGLSVPEASELARALGYQGAKVVALVDEAVRIGALGPQQIQPLALERVALSEVLPISPVGRIELLVKGVADLETADALVALSVFEGFSEHDYYLLANLMKFAATRARLRGLLRDEWVSSQGGAAGGQLRLAERVRHIVRAASLELPPDAANLWRESHRVLADHFASQHDLRAAFHRNALDPSATGVLEAAYLRKGL